MIMAKKWKPTGPLGEQLGLVSVGQIEKMLSAEAGRMITYGQVWAWASRAYNNGFPEAKDHQKRRRGMLVPVYDPDEVLAWHRQYVPDKGGHPWTRNQPPAA
jgi:hypothetical protein